MPSTYLTAKDAVNAAYKSTYDLYHGFIIKQMFQGSFDAAPEVSVILKHMNNRGNDFDDIVTSASSQSDTSQQEPSVSSAPLVIPSSVAVESQNPLDVVAGHVTNEWIKIERFLKQCAGQQRNSQSRNLLVIPEEMEESAVLSENKTDFAVVQPPTSKQTSEEEIPAFVAVAQPMLTELKALVVKLNMNDPSKC